MLIGFLITRHYLYDIVDSIFGYDEIPEGGFNMTSHDNSSKISDEQVVQTLYVFAGKASEQGTPTEEVHDSLMAPDLDSQVAKAVVCQLTSLRDEAHSRRRTARRYLRFSPFVVLVGVAGAFVLQLVSLPVTASLLVGWSAVLAAAGFYLRGRALLQTHLA